jgi:hypothetical protein
MCFRECKLFSEFQELKREKRKEKMLGWCEAIARNPHRIPNTTRTPETSGDVADASQTSTLVSGMLFYLKVACT